MKNPGDTILNFARQAAVEHPGLAIIRYTVPRIFKIRYGVPLIFGGTIRAPEDRR